MKNVSHHLYCTVASSVSEELKGCCYHWNTRSSSLFRLLLCIRVSDIDEGETRIRLKNTAVSSLYIREECCFFSDISKWQICSVDEQSFSRCVYIRFTTIQGHFCSVELFNEYINGIVKDNNSLSYHCRMYVYMQSSRLFMRNDVWKKIFYRIKFVLVDGRHSPMHVCVCVSARCDSCMKYK
jgi:hypothetical protein